MVARGARCGPRRVPAIPRTGDGSAAFIPVSTERSPAVASGAVRSTHEKTSDSLHPGRRRGRHPPAVRCRRGGQAGTDDHGPHPRGPRDAVRRLPRRRARSPARWPPRRTGAAARSPGQVIPGFSAASSTSATARSGRCRTTGSAPRRTQPTSCCASTTSSRGGRRPRAAPARSRCKGFISLRDPDHRIDFPIVHGDTKQRLLTGRGLRHRVDRAPEGRQLLDRRGVRPVPAARRQDGQAARRARSRSRWASPRRTRTSAPVRRPRIKASRGFEAMAGSKDGRYLYPITEGALRRRRPAAPPDDLRVRHPHEPLHGRHLGVPDRPGREPRRGRVHDRAGTQLLVIERDDFQGAGVRDQARLRASTWTSGTSTASSARRSCSTRSRSPTRTASAPATATARVTLLAAGPVVRDRGPARRRAAADRQRQQLPGQRGARSRASPTTPRWTSSTCAKVRAPEGERDDGHRSPRRERLPARAHAGLATRPRSGCARTSSSPTWSRRRTACSSRGTRTRSAARRTSPTTRSSRPSRRPR